MLALDLGTSSIRAVVYDHQGRMVHPTLMTLHYAVDAGLLGQVSSDPDELVALTARAIDGALKAAEKQHFHIEGVAASCYWHSLMGIDHRGQPTTELLTWADTRSAPEAARLRADADRARVSLPDRLLLSCQLLAGKATLAPCHPSRGHPAHGLLGLARGIPLYRALP